MNKLVKVLHTAKQITKSANAKGTLARIVANIIPFLDFAIAIELRAIILPAIY